MDDSRASSKNVHLAFQCNRLNVMTLLSSKDKRGGYASKTFQEPREKALQIERLAKIYHKNDKHRLHNL